MLHRCLGINEGRRSRVLSSNRPLLIFVCCLHGLFLSLKRKRTMSKLARITKKMLGDNAPEVDFHLTILAATPYGKAGAVSSEMLTAARFEVEKARPKAAQMSSQTQLRQGEDAQLCYQAKYLVLCRDS
jgi:hypothetical protein